MTPGSPKAARQGGLPTGGPIRSSGRRPASTVAQQAGVELAGGMAGQLVEEVDRAGHLVAGQVLTGEGQDLGLQLGGRLEAVDQLHAPP